ncbi:MAG: hypothetical protein K0R18_228 [Bacillales bacterium]|jgi:hypothetical protein|nr:hypothetical protein [Bacillales bacterium]
MNVKYFLVFILMFATIGCSANEQQTQQIEKPRIIGNLPDGEYPVLYVEFQADKIRYQIKTDDAYLYTDKLKIVVNSGKNSLVVSNNEQTLYIVGNSIKSDYSSYSKANARKARSSQWNSIENQLEAINKKQ